MNVLPPNYRHIYTTEYQWVVSNWLPGQTNTVYIYYRLLQAYFSYWIYLWASMNLFLTCANSTWIYCRLTTGTFTLSGQGMNALSSTTVSATGYSCASMNPLLIYANSVWIYYHPTICKFRLLDIGGSIANYQAWLSWRKYVFQLMGVREGPVICYWAKLTHHE